MKYQQRVMQNRCGAPAEALLDGGKAGSLIEEKLRSAGLEIEEAELVFDSARQATGTAVRSGVACARQLLYRSGSVCIDMHIQPTLGSVSATLTGQLLDSKKQNRAMRDVPVSLLRSGDMISYKKTNAGGEFNFGVDALQDLQLAFDIRKHKMLVVAVPWVQGEAPLQDR
jgi:hypothetical protein